MPEGGTLRDVIRHRVREEVARHNAGPDGHNGFFVFVGDRQVTDLDEEPTLAETDEVSFVRLVPLVGG